MVITALKIKTNELDINRQQTGHLSDIVGGNATVLSWEFLLAYIVLISKMIYLPHCKM